jgi:hypothetical protein
METPSKDKMVDTMGRPITQSLFLEIGYTEAALYTLKDYDFEYNGRVLPSIKRLYLEIADPTEYEFAQACFLGWNHWQRLCENKAVRKHIDEWRYELEVKLRSRGVKAAMLAAYGGNFQASKWLADRGWDTRGAGRPSKADVEKETKIQAAISEEYSADILRLNIK